MSVIKFFNFIWDAFPIIVTVLIILSLIGAVVYQLFQIWALQKENSANEKAIESLVGSNRIKLTEAYAERDAIKIHLDAAYETINELRAVNSDINKSNDELIEKMLATDKVRENLIKCIERTGIRDSKGIVRKVKEGEIQSVISGNHPILLPKVTIKAKDKFTDRVEKLIEDFNSVRSVKDINGKKYAIELNSDYERDEILKLMDEVGVIRMIRGCNIPYNYPYCVNVEKNKFYYSKADHYIDIENFTILPASDFIQPKMTEPNTAGGRDWSVPQAFPNEYVIPIGTKVVCVADDRPDDSDNYSVGKIRIVQDKDRLPDVLFNDDLDPTVMRITELAPLDPLDHPEHPQFKMK